MVEQYKFKMAEHYKNPEYSCEATPIDRAYEILRLKLIKGKFTCWYSPAGNEHILGVTLNWKPKVVGRECIMTKEHEADIMKQAERVRSVSQRVAGELDLECMVEGPEAAAGGVPAMYVAMKSR